MVNLDFFARAIAAANYVFTLLGEGTFHQVHGGAATGLPKSRLHEKFKQWREESEALGQVIALDYEFILAGHMPSHLREFFELCVRALVCPGTNR